MARPRTPHPTPAELEVLKRLWEHGPLTVRDLLPLLTGDGPPRAYTSVMSLLNVMSEKGLLEREPVGRAFRYHPCVAPEQTLSRVIGDVWQRVFGGSTSALVAHLLETATPTAEELARIRQTLAQYESGTQDPTDSPPPSPPEPRAEDRP